MIAIILVFLYIVGVYVLPRLIVPNYGFRKGPLPNILPEKVQKELDLLKKNSISREAFLKNAYDLVTTEYQGGRFKTLLDINRAFQNPLTMKPGYMHCHNQNYLIRVFLVKSGYFHDGDIEVHTVFFNFFTHQYLKVKVDTSWVYVDPAAKAMGIPFGKRAFLFG